MWAPSVHSVNHCHLCHGCLGRQIEHASNIDGAWVPRRVTYDVGGRVGVRSIYRPGLLLSVNPKP